MSKTTMVIVAARVQEGHPVLLHTMSKMVEVRFAAAEQATLSLEQTASASQQATAFERTETFG